jgi:hypothetical protein
MCLVTAAYHLKTLIISPRLGIEIVDHWKNSGLEQAVIERTLRWQLHRTRDC